MSLSSKARRAGLLRAAGLLPALLLAAPAVSAHSLNPRAGDFYNGLAHAFIDPAQALLLLALGLWTARRGIQRAAPVLLGVPLLMFAASVLLALGLELPHAGVLLLLAAAQCGLLLAWDRPLPAAIFLPLALWPALALGAVNAQELEAMPELAAHLYLPGAALGAFLLLSWLLYLGDRLLALPWGWLPVALRVAGSWVAAFALLMLALSASS